MEYRYPLQIFSHGLRKTPVFVRKMKCYSSMIYALAPLICHLPLEVCPSSRKSLVLRIHLFKSLVVIDEMSKTDLPRRIASWSALALLQAQRAPFPDAGSPRGHFDSSS